MDTVVQGRRFQLLRVPCSRCGGKPLYHFNGVLLSVERRGRGVSVAALAKKMKVTPTYVWMIETNQRKCSEMRAKRYLMALDAIVADGAAKGAK